MNILSDEEINVMANSRTHRRTSLIFARRIEAAVIEKLMKRAGDLPASRAVRETLATIFGEVKE